MDTILVTVAVVAIAVAAVLGVMLARVRAEDRRRSEARVAMLTELTAERPTAEAPATISPHLFQREQAASPWPWRVAVIAGLLVVLGGAGFAWRTLAPRAQGSAAKEVRGTTLPLELLSLRHAHDDRTFTVTGLVQNPVGTAPVSGVQATVLVFDSQGSMVTSGRAAVDFTQLSAGDESPFVIRVPVQGPVARYRVGFRGSDGRVLAHVDRRNQDSVAQKQIP